jgi:hypothetical protein
MNGRRAGIFVSLLGRTAARILYVVLGLLIAGAGVAGALGLIG